MRYTKDMRLSSICKNRIEVWASVMSDTKNRLGQYPKEDKHLFDVYGAVLPQTGSLLNGRQADTTLCRTTHKIVLRYNDKITSANWFVYNGVRYDILYIMDPYLNSERLECYCEVVI